MQMSWLLGSQWVFTQRRLGALKEVGRYIDSKSTKNSKAGYPEAGSKLSKS